MYLVAGADVLLSPVDMHTGSNVGRLLLQRDHQVQRLVVKACTFGTRVQFFKLRSVLGMVVGHVQLQIGIASWGFRTLRQLGAFGAQQLQIWILCRAVIGNSIRLARADANSRGKLYIPQLERLLQNNERPFGECLARKRTFTCADMFALLLAK